MGVLNGLAGSVVWFESGADGVVAEIAEWSLDLSGAVVPVTAFGDENDRVVPNLARAVGSFVGNFDPSDAGQAAMRSALMAGAAVRLILYFDDTRYVDTLAAHVTGSGPAIGVSGKAVESFDFGVKGRIDTSTGETLLLLENDDLVLLEDGAGVRGDVVDQW